ncbi:MAG: N-acetyltransferase family protein [Bryobacteraceae bacterium]|jgi:phosphinothricin acetyltransferase
MSPTLRPSTDADLPAIDAIYAHHVRTGLASFETVPPTVEEMARRRLEVLKRGLPFLVAEVEGTVVGYAYASLYRPRPAYRSTLEDSIYIHPEHTRQGIGRLLLQALLADCEAKGYRQMVAIIGDSGNAPSIGLHQAFGFEHAGTLRSVGFKFGRWVDTVLMQRPLGAADSTLPGDR